MKSPFQFGREVAKEELVDRVEELQEVLDTIESAGRLFLIGPRRFGKTSILTTAAIEARRRGSIVIQVNAEEYASLDSLAAEIVKQAGEQLRSKLTSAVALIKNTFGALNPQISYDPLTNAWAVGVTAKSGEQQTTYLTDALNSLNELAGQVDQPVALIIDEFQHTVAVDGLLAERQLRAVVQRHRNVAYIFAGSAESMLMAMTGEHSRPFYRLGSRRFLGPVPRPDFRAYITAGFAKANLDIAPTATEYILNLAEDVPYSVQRLADVTWRAANLADGQPTIDEAFVEECVEQLLAVEAPHYGASVSRLTPAQLKTLVLVSNITGKALTSSATARKVGLAQSTVRRSLGALESRGIIRQIHDGKPGTRWAHEDPFFGEWVRRRIKA